MVGKAVAVARSDFSRASASCVAPGSCPKLGVSIASWQWLLRRVAENETGDVAAGAGAGVVLIVIVVCCWVNKLNRGRRAAASGLVPAVGHLPRMELVFGGSEISFCSNIHVSADISMCRETAVSLSVHLYIYVYVMVVQAGAQQFRARSKPHRATLGLGCFHTATSGELYVAAASWFGLG